MYLSGLGNSGWSAADAATLATKWYVLYLGRQPDASGLSHWITEIQNDGPALAWQNFSSSSEPMAANATGKAQQLASEYGGPTEIGPTGGIYTPPTAVGTDFTPPADPTSPVSPFSTGLFPFGPAITPTPVAAPVLYTAPTSATPPSVAPTVHTTPSVYQVPAPFNTATLASTTPTVLGMSTTTLMLLAIAGIVGFVALRGHKASAP
jgi:hypothetical protein